MKTRIVTNLFCGMLLANFALTSASAQAQTYEGQKFLAELPVSFKAAVFPSHNSVIHVALENYSARPVHIRFLNADHRVLCEDIVQDRAYHRRFNVQQLPSGTYTVVITSRNARFVQPFQIGWQTPEQTLTVVQPQDAHNESLLATSALPR